MTPPARNVIVLDRDGTIVIDRNYLDDPDGLAFLPGARAGLRWLYEHGYRLIVITNQSGIARGLFSTERLHEIHQRLNEMIIDAGARLEGIYFCPHGPDEGCECRKPRSALLEQAARELSFNLSAVIVVGDKPSDVELGQRVGAPGILIAGHGAAQSEDRAPHTFVARDLSDAASIIDRINRSET
jgi:D-glycero-D-manno-heptose 1,7-bisphosphate phosphatase